MGTSVSHSSPKTSGWKAVSVCYTHADIPIERAATEIWRAAVSPGSNLQQQLSTSLVSSCMQAVVSGASSDKVSSHFQELNSLKQNTVVGEFAKRASIIKAAGGFPNESHTAVLFRQLTDYYVARDIAGHVGDKFRCKTVSEIRTLKQQLGQAVAKKVQAIEQTKKLATKNWTETFQVVLKALTQ